MGRFKKNPGRRLIYDHLEARRLLTLVVSPLNITATQGTAFDGIVATLVDTTRRDSPSSFTTAPGSVQINWGDGSSPTTGQVVGPVYPGVFEVEGSHTYTATGPFETQISVADQSGNNAIASGSAAVTSQPPQLTIVGQTITGAAGTPTGTVTVATFHDTNTSDTAGDFQAVITWGDGNTTIGTVQAGSGAGTFTVTGSNTYAAGGTYTTNVTVLDLVNAVSAVATGQAIISAAPSPYDLTGVQIVETAGVPFNATVATFTDANTSDTAGDFTAAIDWGDGHTGTGTVTGSNGNFAISGSYVYSAPGIYTVMVTLIDNVGGTASTASTATVAAPTVIATGTTFSAAPGVLTNQTVATFTDPNADAASSTVLINWGDGQTSTGTVGATGTSGVYMVTGSHAYPASVTATTYAVIVTIVDPSGQTATANSTADVAPIFATINPITTTAVFTAGVTPSSPVTVGSFFDSTAGAMASEFTASIKWGNGNVSAGTVMSSSTPGLFLVSGTNTYAAPGNYTVMITVQGPTGSPVTFSSTADVGPVPTPLQTIATTAYFTTGVLPSSPVTVGSFYDSNTAAMASEFTASIDWGDGDTTLGTVTPAPGSLGLFLVSGAHLYSAAGSYMLTIAIQDQTIPPSGQPTTIQSTAMVTTYNVNAPDFSGSLSLANAFTNGPHAALGFTNTNRPTFSGTAPAYSVVQVYARHFNADAVLSLGEAVADANGNWTLTTGPLAVGTYIVSATYTIPGGYPSSLIPLDGGNRVYIGLAPRFVRRHSHGEKVVAHQPSLRVTHPVMPKPPRAGHHKA